MNRWRIPPELELQIRDRDVKCVYCGVKLLESVPRGTSRKNVATWEHIVNDASIISFENIARCCNSCNASKGSKDLRKWLDSDYCRRNRITKDSVAFVVQCHLSATMDQPDVWELTENAIPWQRNAIQRICRTEQP